MLDYCHVIKDIWTSPPPVSQTQSENHPFIAETIQEVKEKPTSWCFGDQL